MTAESREHSLVDERKARTMAEASKGTRERAYELSEKLAKLKARHDPISLFRRWTLQADKKALKETAQRQEEHMGRLVDLFRVAEDSAEVKRLYDSILDRARRFNNAEVAEALGHFIPLSPEDKAEDYDEGRLLTVPRVVVESALVLADKDHRKRGLTIASGRTNFEYNLLAVKAGLQDLPTTDLSPVKEVYELFGLAAYSSDIRTPSIGFFGGRKMRFKDYNLHDLGLNLEFIFFGPHEHSSGDGELRFEPPAVDLKIGILKPEERGSLY